MTPACLALLLLVPALQPAAQPVTTPATPAPAATATPPLITSADDLLAALERADGRITSLAASVLFDQVKGIDADRRKRYGKVWYKDARAATPPGPRMFAVRFERVQIGKRIQDEVQELIFDGQWMVEKKPAQKQVIKQQVARAGESFDPLRIGEGPFPLPIGQKSAAIRARYDVALLPPAQELQAHEPAEQADLEKFVAGTYQLRLIPKPELLPTEELKEIRLWYRAEPAPDGGINLLPRLARTLNRAGDVSIVQMKDVQLNQPVPADAIDASIPDGWDAQVRELAPPPRTPATPDR